MPGIGWLVVSVVLAIVLTSWVTFTATRLDRLHARVDAAQAALDAQLVRRAAALQHLADSAIGRIGVDRSAAMVQVAQQALNAGSDQREPVENALGKAVNELGEFRDQLLPDYRAPLKEVADASTKVVIARRFYNDAVRDTRTLRTGRMPRLLRLAGHRGLPQFFDIDDSTTWSITAPLPGGTP